MEKMSVLIDADVILEGLLSRSEFTAEFDEVHKLLEGLVCDIVNGYIAILNEL